MNEQELKALIDQKNELENQKTEITEKIKDLDAQINEACEALVMSTTGQEEYRSSLLTVTKTVKTTEKLDINAFVKATKSNALFFLKYVVDGGKVSISATKTFQKSATASCVDLTPFTTSTDNVAYKVVETPTVVATEDVDF